MERLTFEGNFCDIAQCAEIPGGSFCENGACSQRKVWERLKAYEDTGLEPEQLADTVPVVRCKDCLWAYKIDCRELKYACRNICRFGCTQWLDSNDFCSYGERKMND